MDLKKFLTENNFQNIPAGLTGCRVYGIEFDSCDYDVILFDGKKHSEVFSYDNHFVNIHHQSINETRTESLVHLDGMQIIQDNSLELGAHLSKFRERRVKLFEDHARNCLIYSLFCCQKYNHGFETDTFYSCWQKSALYLLTDAILSLNQKPPSPSHALELARKFEKNIINEKILSITQTLGIERATPSLLERMLKSTIGFSDIVYHDYSKIIQKKYDFFVKNSMFSDCYFYLGYVNHVNFMKIKDSLSHRTDLIHILKTAFDLEPNLTSQHILTIQGTAQELLSIMRKPI